MISERRNPWCIEQTGYNQEREQYYESLFSLGNGYMGVRGYHEEDNQKGPHERSQFIAGLFDYLDDDITDMVNTPGFFYSDLRIQGSPVDYSNQSIKDYTSTLNMEKGILKRAMTFQDPRGYETRVEKERFISMDQRHIACMRYRITPLNYSGDISYETGIRGDVANNPINDDQMKINLKTITLLDALDLTSHAHGGRLRMVTRTKKEEIAECYGVQVDSPSEILEEALVNKEQKYVGSRYRIQAEEGVAYTFTKYISIYTSRDTEDVTSEASRICEEAMKIGYEGLLEKHVKVWAKKWEEADIQVEGPEGIQGAIRYNIFQLIQTNAEEDYRVSIGARGIMHGRYKGCFFWDTEIFMLPFYLYTNPVAAKNLLRYRHYTLEGARENARARNLAGIKFPWMSSADGLEQCESWDTGACEIHINGDVPYAYHHYFQATGDEDFNLNYGAEIYIETARYWSDRFSYDADKDIYNMLFVKGPNEYGGVTLNNTYTTYMAIHNLYLAIEVIHQLKEQGKWKSLSESIGFSEEEVVRWQDIMEKAVICYDEEKALYIEDGHFYDLEPISLEVLGDDVTPLYQKISFDRLQRFRVLKQGDVIQLMTLFPRAFTMKEKQMAWETYEPITLHDSTLSYGTHALFAASIGLLDEAWAYFVKSITLDVDDVMGNTDREGIHFASLGISWQALVMGFGGMHVDEEGLVLEPRLPKQLEALRYPLVYRNNSIRVSIREDNIELLLMEESALDTLDITLWGERITLHKNHVKHIKGPNTEGKKALSS